MSAMPETPMLVSVLITAYNAEPWIAETLGSAVGQTWRTLEVVVVDDGSTDGTLDVIRTIAGEHTDVVRVVAQENRGACAARNRALTEARGDFIQYLDADDLIEPDKIERQMRQLETEPHGTIAAGPWVRFYGDDPSTVDKTQRGPDWRDYEPATDWLVQSWEGQGTIPSFAWLTPRHVVEQAGSWNEGLLRNQDGEYFARVLINARKIAFVEGAWGYYRSGQAGSVSKRMSDAALRSLFDSTVLCEQALLAARDTERTRRAVAGLYQQFLFTAYPAVPDLVKQAEARVEELGGMYRSPGVSRPFRPVRDLIGWKPALQLQYLYQRFRQLSKGGGRRLRGS